MRNIPMKEWGKDHWSLLGYIETRCVDYKGVMDHKHMRCNPKTHPGLRLHQHMQEGWESSPYLYGSVLRERKVEPEHDDWDCFYDIEKEGLIEDIGTGIHPVAKLTALGKRIASALRAHKADGKVFATFIPSEVITRTLP